MTRSIGTPQHDHSGDGHGGGSLSPESLFTELETADVRMYARSDGTHDAHDEDGVIDEGVADAATLYETVLANISGSSSVAWYPGTYSWNKDVTQSLGALDWVTPGRSVKLRADSAITNFLTVRKAGGVVGVGPDIDGLTVDGNGNADRFMEIDTVRYGRLQNVRSMGLGVELVLAYSDQTGNNTDNWSARDIQVSGSRFGTLRAGSTAMAADWDLENVHVGGIPANDWALIIRDTHNHDIKNFFGGRNDGTEIAGAVLVESPGANAGAIDPMTGVELSHVGMENTNVAATGAETVRFDGAGNRLQDCLVDGIKAVGDGATPVRFANTGGTIRRNRGNEARGFLKDAQPVAVVDADVYRANIQVHRSGGNDTNDNVNDAGDFTTVNNIGYEAAGAGAQPTSRHWDTGALVENTSDGTVWLKTGPSAFVQLG